MENYKKILIHICILTVLIIPVFTHAQPVGPGTGGGITIDNPLKCSDNSCNTLPSLLRTLLNNVVMPVAAVFVTVWIIYAGFSYVMAQGNEKKVSEAHQRLLWSLV